MEILQFEGQKKTHFIWFCFEENEVYAMNLSFLTHLQSVNPIIISESSCFNSILQQTSQIYQIIRKIIADHQ